MADYRIDKIHYGSDTYNLKDSNALHLTDEGTLKIDGTLWADQGIFNKLIATSADIGTLDVDDLTADNATVVGLLDVKGEIHTNSWTNANIANIGGSFYITPTIESATATLRISGSASNRTIAVSDGTFETDTIQKYENETTSPINWVVGSKVMVTGSVKSETSMEYPLGTCVGTLSAALTNTGFTIQSINSNALEEIIATLGTTSLSGVNIKLSMYEVGPSSAYKPVGILLTSYGFDKSTYIDIYGGVNSKGRAYDYYLTRDTEYHTEKTYYILEDNTYTEAEFVDDSFIEGIKYYERISIENYTEPNVRIGYLGGIPSYIDSAGNIHKPVGWGIYTDNGYFKGTIISDSGTIGGFTIDNNSISNQKLGESGSVIISTGTTGSARIGGSGNISSWAFTAGNNFGVTTEGGVYASNIIINSVVDGMELQLDGKALQQTYNQVQTLNDLISIEDFTDGTGLLIHQKITYQLTEDTEIDSQKIYYIYDDEDGIYIPVDTEDLNVDDIRTYYERINQTGIRNSQNGISFIQINNENELEVARIENTTDQTLYVENLKPISLIFGNLELIEYNNGLGIRRIS